MARTPKKNQELIEEYEKDSEEKIDKTSQKATWKNTSTGKESSIKNKIIVWAKITKI